MIHVYIGPTLAPTEPALRVWRLRVLPPARHGDLDDPAIERGHTVVLIDGVYHQAPALRHKEILAAMSGGVRVIGAASIGALRAAELRDHGMLGSGRIYHAYVSGALTGDDEVAVGQAPDGDLNAQTWPLVNLRHILRAAEHERILTGRTATLLLQALAEIPYQQRTEPAVRAVCRRIAGSELLLWLRARRLRDPHWGDVKRADALGALALAQAREPLSVPRGGQPFPVSTGYTRAWANRRAVQEIGGRTLPTAARLAYQQIFDPEFPQVWGRWLEHLAGQDGAVPLGRRLTYVLDDHPDPAAPAAYLVFRPVPDLRDPGTAAFLISRETAADRDAVARYAAANTAMRDQVPGFSPEAVDDGIARRTLARLWRTGADPIEDAAAARGFRNAADAVDHMKNFLAGFLADTAERTV
ncbi:TfuA-like protein [Streptomyces sp. NBC_01207]|uniref:TfuA-like protein n=1 Tax=Streptomyces sp. NBC_01207 TaxID=2903772 RepID=UPI002E0FB736|nr:TfuA-like protein [Streptomyces sp. NBC_01207]